jgi:hypothetical protein
MILFRDAIIILALFFLTLGKANAEGNRDDFYRNFWSPKYHALQLSYCSMDGKSCGMEVANAYCKVMGYKKANKEIIAHNVGLTHYLGTNGQCKGWECNGFKLIRCVGEINNKPPEGYAYNLR